jgi:hypothetical protein
MTFSPRVKRIMFMLLGLAFLAGTTPWQARAQYPPPQAPPQAPPSYPPDELDALVGRVALYPDPLLAQVLAAATYPDQIPDAARWADEHHYLHGDDLANAITEDHLTFDASVQALLPFPPVLDLMASDMNWTAELGNAFLAQHDDVMDAVQRMRQKAASYGYLRSNQQVVVSTGPYITIMPVTPTYVCVPAYDPRVVFFAPGPGIFVGAGIHFGFGIILGFGFAPWGWGSTRIAWGTHDVFIAGGRWGRSWGNRGTYVHPYRDFHAYRGPAVPDHHELIRRSEGERRDAREGRAHAEEHHAEHDHHR